MTSDSSLSSQHASLDAFLAFLHQQRPSMLATITANFGQQAAEGEHDQLVEILDLLVTYLHTPARAIASLNHKIDAGEFRFQTQQQAYKQFALVRSLLLNTAVEAVRQQIPHADQGIQLAIELTDSVSLVMSRLYQRRLHLMEALLNTAAVGVLVRDIQGTVRYMNPAMADLMGAASIEHIVASGVPLLVDADDPERFERDILPTTIEQEQCSWKAWSLRMDQTRFYGQFTSFSLWDEAGDGLLIASLVRDITDEHEAELERERYAAALEVAHDRIEQSLATTPLITIEWDLNGTLRRWNNAAEQTFGWSGTDIIGKSVFEQIIPAEAAGQVRQMVQDLIDGKPANTSRNRNRTKDGRLITCQWYNALLRDHDGKPVGVLSQAQDMTRELAAQEERAQLQQQLIHAQQAALRELSTPLIPLANHLLAMPLIGTIDSSRAQQVIETLLVGVGQHQADMVILDITGVPLVDTQVANALLRAAQAVKLLGAQVILTGIRPEVAQTLVGLGVDLSSIITRSNLQEGISFALKRS